MHRTPSIFSAFILCLFSCLASLTGCSGGGDGVFDRTLGQWVEQTDILHLQGREGDLIAAAEINLPFGTDGSDPNVVFLGMEPASSDEDVDLEFFQGDSGVRVAVVSRREEGFMDGRVRIRLTCRVTVPGGVGRKPFDLEDVGIVKVLDTRVQNRSEGVTLFWDE
jgi:hypothetical protein